MIELIKVKTSSNPNAVAVAISNILKTQKKIKVQAIGAGSINQAVKSLAVARSYLVLSGNDLNCISTFNACNCSNIFIESVGPSILVKPG